MIQRYCRWLTIVLCSLTFGACTSAVEVSKSPQPVTLDPGVLSGELDNGFRYYLRSANSAPQNDRLEIRLVVKAGSLHEKINQRGFSHLLEHMAFRGTKSFPAERIESLLSDNGLRWGEDVNATTHYGATVYRFSLHQSDHALVPLILELMSEWLNGIEFEQLALEREKRIVDAEWRERYAERNHVIDPVIVSAYAGSVYDNRQPAGDLNTIHSATTEALRQYWVARYKPNNAVLIVTGGARPWQLEPLIDSVFSKLTSNVSVVDSNAEKSDFASTTDLTFYKDDLLVNLQSRSDPTLTLPELSVSLISRLSHPPRDIESTVEIVKNRFRSQLLFNVYSYLLRDRISNTRECSNVELYASLLESGQTLEQLTVKVPADDLLRCLTDAYNAIKALRRVRLTSEEYQSFRTLFDDIAQSNVAQYRNRGSATLADGLVDMVTNGEHLLSAWELQKTLERVVAELTHEETNRLIKGVTESYKLVFSVTTNKATPFDTVSLMSAINNDDTGLQAKLKSTVVHGELKNDQTRLALTSADHLLFTDESESRHNSKGLEKVRIVGNYHEWRLANGATVVLLQNDDQNQIAVTAISDGGFSGVNGVSSVVAEALPGFLSVNGIDGYLSRSLRNIMNEQQVVVEPFVEPLHHGINASGDPDKLSMIITLIDSYFGRPVVLESQSAVFIEQLKVQKNLNRRHHAIALPADDANGLQWINNQSFLQAHRAMYGSMENYGFVFVGAIDPLELEEQLQRLDSGVERRLFKRNRLDAIKANGGVSTSPTSNIYWANHGARTTDVSVIQSCAIASDITYGSEFIDRGLIDGDGSDYQHWRLLADIIAERLRYTLREQHGLVYDLENTVVVSDQLIQEITYTVLPADERRAAALTSEVLASVSSLGVTQAELQAAQARAARSALLDISVNVSRARDLAQQWLVGGRAIPVSDRRINLDGLNRLARCMDSATRQVAIQSYETFVADSIRRNKDADVQQEPSARNLSTRSRQAIGQ